MAPERKKPRTKLMTINIRMAFSHLPFPAFVSSFAMDFTALVFPNALAVIIIVPMIITLLSLNFASASGDVIQPVRTSSSIMDSDTAPSGNLFVPINTSSNNHIKRFIMISGVTFLIPLPVHKTVYVSTFWKSGFLLYTNYK